jgi:hypothetical protein
VLTLEKNEEELGLWSPLHTQARVKGGFSRIWIMNFQGFPNLRGTIDFWILACQQRLIF